MQNCSDQADGWFPGTSNLDKELLPTNFFQMMQKIPHQTQFTFCQAQGQGQHQCQT